MEYNEKVINAKYKLIPRTLIFIEKEEKILLIHKNKKDSFGYSKLNGIGGHIEKGEEPFEAAKREIYEESGLSVKNLTLVAIIFIEIGINPGILLFVFKADYSIGEPSASEEGNLYWMSREEISTHTNIIKDIPFLLEISDSHQIDTPPTIGKYLYNKSGELRIVIHEYS